jgi:hypothetical protein
VQNGGQEIFSKECGRSIACSNRPHTLSECVTAFSVLGLGISRLSDTRSKCSDHNCGRVKCNADKCLELLLR